MVNTKEVPYTQTHIRRNGAPDLKHETTAVIQVLAVGETAYRNYLKELGLSYETAKIVRYFTMRMPGTGMERKPHGR